METGMIRKIAKETIPVCDAVIGCNGVGVCWMNEKIIVGICEDERKDAEHIYRICVQYLNARKITGQFHFFSNGKEVLQYCEDKEKSRIDLLFLDIEMPQMDGIEVKNRLLRQRNIWRITFVSGHLENVFDAYGLKTIGFIPKPVAVEKIQKAIATVMLELREKKSFLISDIANAKRNVNAEDILYLKADGSYTEIYVMDEKRNQVQMILCTKKLGVLEKEWEDSFLIRVHKTYMVNLPNVMSIDQAITIREVSQKIPIGRKYKEETRRQYIQFGKEIVRSRL